MFKKSMKIFKHMVIILSIVPILISCKDTREYKDIEIDILSTKLFMKYSWKDQYWGLNRHAEIEFTVNNIGDKPIEGWKIFFRITTDDSRQLDANQIRYYNLMDGEVSEKQVIYSAAIPDIFGDPVDSFVKHFEVW